MEGKMTSIQAIKAYFDSSDRPVTFAELKELGGDGVREMGELCAAELGVEIVAPAKK